MNPLTMFDDVMNSEMEKKKKFLEKFKKSIKIFEDNDSIKAIENLILTRKMIIKKVNFNSDTEVSVYIHILKDLNERILKRLK